jgi:hypothetical protein
VSLLPRKSSSLEWILKNWVPELAAEAPVMLVHCVALLPRVLLVTPPLLPLRPVGIADRLLDEVLLDK